MIKRGWKEKKRQKKIEEKKIKVLYERRKLFMKKTQSMEEMIKIFTVNSNGFFFSRIKGKRE